MRKAVEEIVVSLGYARMMTRDLLRLLDERIGGPSSLNGHNSDPKD